MKEHTTLRIARYRSPDGRPTCCEDLRVGASCEFMRFAKMGTMPVCGISENPIIAAGSDFTRPHDQCIVWEEV